MQAAARIDLPSIKDEINNAIGIDTSEDAIGSLTGLIPGSMAMYQEGDRGPLSLENYDMSWMTEAPLTENSIFEDISIPSISDLESPELLPSVTRSPLDQCAEMPMATLPNAALDLPFQTSLDDLDDFHRIWPHLHWSTITTVVPSGLLGQALHHVAQHNNNINDGAHLAECTNRLLMPHPKTDQISSIPISDLQALSVVLISTILHDTSSKATDWAVQWTEIATSVIRRLGMLELCWKSSNISSPEEEKAWIHEEESKRLVYTILRIDAYLSLITGHPPSLRVQELRLSLPVTENVWTASTFESRQQLCWFEPAGRAQTTLNAIVGDGLARSRSWMPGDPTGMPPLLPADNHLVLCALQGEIWVAAHETQSLNHGSSNSISSWRVPESVNSWRRYLLNWHAHTQLGPSTMLPDETSWDTLNQTQYHLCQLTLHAPLQLLESRHWCIQCCRSNTTAMLRAWASSIESRRAVYHAAQLQRLHDGQAGFISRRWLDPLQVPALLASAVVLCSYAADCPYLETGDPIEICQEASGTSPAFDEWIQHGGLATACGQLLSSPSLQGLFSWFQERLVMFPQNLGRVTELKEKLS